MGKKAEAIVAHGMTARQFEELKLRKLSNDIEMIPANLAAKLQDEIFAKEFGDYEIKMHERQHYHVIQEMRLFNQGTGKRDSVAAVVTYDKAMWPTVKDSDVFKDYTRELVHNPELEEKNAPMITLKYTLTDEEVAAQSEEAVSGDEAEVKPKAKAKAKAAKTEE